METAGHLADAIKFATTFATGGGLVAVLNAVAGSKKTRTEIEMSVRKQNFDELKIVADKHEAAANKCAEERETLQTKFAQERATLQGQLADRDILLDGLRHEVMALETRLHQLTLRLIDAGLPADDLLTTTLTRLTPHQMTPQ